MSLFLVNFSPVIVLNFFNSPLFLTAHHRGKILSWYLKHSMALRLVWKSRILPQLTKILRNRTPSKPPLPAPILLLLLTPSQLWFFCFFLSLFFFCLFLTAVIVAFSLWILWVPGTGEESPILIMYIFFLYCTYITSKESFSLSTFFQKNLVPNLYTVVLVWAMSVSYTIFTLIFLCILLLLDDLHASYKW